MISENVEYFVLISTFLKSKWRITYLSKYTISWSFANFVIFFDQNSVAAREASMYRGI